ncbi:hypothetical protein [Alteromonas sp. H39]|uniref:hypothetical protein n=1 Tax=Alteromonas sp. H39 TaxID=3389876 RepID=UPI0039E142FC
MQLTYLCPKHADWVYTNPQQAVHFLTRNDMQGSLLYHGGQYCDAIPYLGCAFDIAAILLELEEGNDTALINTVKALTFMLGSAYQLSQRWDCYQAIHTRASKLLAAVATYQEHQERVRTGELTSQPDGQRPFSPGK